MGNQVSQLALRVFSTRLRRDRLIALVAAITLLAAFNLYSTHGLGKPAHEHAHCLLCASLGSTAGSSGQAAFAGKPILTVLIPRGPAGLLLLEHRRARAHLPRAPPRTS